MKKALPILTALIAATLCLCACIREEPNHSDGAPPEHSTAQPDGNEGDMDGDNNLEW